jgi:hypothetical protein
MQLSPSPPRSFTWRRRVVALAFLALLAGCANGDYKEIRPSLVRDDIHDWIGSAAIAGINTSPSNYPLTDDERALRDLAYPLIQPAYDRHRWYSIAGEYGLIASDHSRAFDRTVYAQHLFTPPYRSPSSRYARLSDDIHDDMTRLPQFFETAARVLDIDRKRRESLAYIPDLSKQEKDEALRRIFVNASIVLLVRSKLHQRVASYRYALGRLVLECPMQQAVQVELALNELQARIDYYDKHAAPTWVREQSLASSG